MEYIVVIVILGLSIAAYCSIIYNSTSHSKGQDNVLKVDAQICNIKTEDVGGRKITNAALRTTVKFDDGFVYISHKSKKRWLTIYVDALVLNEIKEDAINAHKKAYEKQCYNKQLNSNSTNNDSVNKKNSFETTKITNSNITSQNTAKNFSVDEMRRNQIIKFTTFAATSIQEFAIADDFAKFQDEIIDCLNKELLALELIFNDELYNEFNQKSKEALDDLKLKSLAIAFYIILKIGNDFPSLQRGVIYAEILKVLYFEIQGDKEDIFYMKNDDLKKFFVDSIISNIKQ